jgi:hypothetical protein
MSPLDPEIPPAGEEIHLPGPTILPFLLAIGLTCVIIGLTITWALTIAGGVLSIVVIWRWIADTRRDIAELPVEHQQHHV